MHQPLTVAHEEGVRFVNGEIIHLLRGFFDGDGFNFARGAVRVADVIANFQIFRVYPTFIFHEEGMLMRGFQFFAVNGEVDDGFIRVMDGVRDGVERDFVGLFVPRNDS